MFPRCRPQGKQARFSRFQCACIVLDQAFQCGNRRLCLARLDQRPLQCFSRRPCRMRQRMVGAVEARQTADPFGRTRCLGQRCFDLGIGESRYKNAICDEAIELADLVLPCSGLGALWAPVERGRLAAKRWVKKTPWALAFVEQMRAGPA